MDPRVNGQLQKQWGWLIAGYLFLGGVGGGAYIIAALNSFLGQSQELATRVGLWIAFPALFVGSLLLVADLGRPERAFLAGRRPGTSWIARGTWIISGFMVISFLHLILREFRHVDGGSGMATLTVLGSLLALATVSYTGILLGASKGIPFWRSGVVPAVFVVSAVVTGHFAIMLGVSALGRWNPMPEAMRKMALEADGLVVLEVLVILFFLQAAFKIPDSRESAERILRKTSFVVGYILLGLGAPFALMLAVYKSPAGASTSSLSLLIVPGAVLGLVGGLILREAVLACGALPTLNVAGFEFRRIHRPKEPKPDVGMLPPQ